MKPSLSGAHSTQGNERGFCGIGTKAHELSTGRHHLSQDESQIINVHHGMTLSI